MAKKIKAKRDIHQEVTDSIIASLEAGTPAWVKPWDSSHDGMFGSLGMPRNLNGREYRGVNTLLLWCEEQAHGYRSPFWGTFKMVKSKGGNVRKGEKGTLVTLWKPWSRENAEGKQERGLMLRHYTVFNAEQCEGLPEKFYSQPEAAPKPVEGLADTERVEAMEAEMAAALGRLGLSGGFEERGGRACYSLVADRIQVPEFEKFKTAADYYATSAHEMVHATGAEKRLKRDMSGHFGSADYAFEELVAEIGSAFIGARIGLPIHELQHPSYIASWIKKLSDDKKCIISAASKAQKAADMVLGTTVTYEEEKPEKAAEAA